jgi:hypothetical protein
MTEYTPTTEEVRLAYNHWGKYPEFAPDDFDVTRAEFDSWLASVRADAWDEGRNAIGSYKQGHAVDCAGWEDCYCAVYTNPYRSEKQ